MQSESPAAHKGDGHSTRREGYYEIWGEATTCYSIASWTSSVWGVTTFISTQKGVQLVQSDRLVDKISLTFHFINEKGQEIEKIVVGEGLDRPHPPSLPAPNLKGFRVGDRRH